MHDAYEHMNLDIVHVGNAFTQHGTLASSEHFNALNAISPSKQPKDQAMGTTQDSEPRKADLPIRHLSQLVCGVHPLGSCM